MEYNNVQKQIITTKEPHVLVPSAAASGKTKTLVGRIQYLLSQGVPPEEIVAITFTNNAASVMYERLGYPNGLFIGTIHSYCNYLLRGNAIDTSKIIQEERFDELFQEIRRNPNCIKHVTYLISDESQDVSTEQFEFYEMINPDNYMYFYDVRQELYRWRGSDSDYLIKKEKEDDVVVYHMRQNYRNKPDILRFAKRFLYRLGPDYEDDSISMKDGGDLNNVLEITLTLNEAVDMLVTANNQMNRKWGDWFILCRTNADIDTFKMLLAKRNIPMDTFKQAELTNAQIQDRLNANTVKVLTVHSAKGLESPCVLSYNIRAYSDDEAKVCYVSATRAEDFLLWVKAPSKKRRKNRIVNWE